MNRSIRQNRNPFNLQTCVVRRAAALALALLFLFCFPRVSRAEKALFPLGTSSDDVLRVELRLSDLGYYTGVVNGRWDQADADALAVFAAANAVTTSGAALKLFSSDALPAAKNASSVFATGTSSFVMTFGTLMPWSEVKAKLQTGVSYNITSCYSGITLHMICVSVGSHAKFTPELEWDNATLRGFFSSDSSSEKQPVVLTIDGVLIAASIQQAAPSADETALPEYSVFFHDSLSEINGIPDAEHEAIVQIAATKS